MQYSRRLALAHGFQRCRVHRTVAVRAVTLAVVLSGSIATTEAYAQAAGEPAGALQVLLDCGVCDGAHIRREIDWVRWVRDRADADVHVLGVQQAAGAGGVQYELTLLGRRGFTGRADTLRFFSGPEETSDERRDRVVHAIQLALVRYAATTPLASRLRVSVERDSTAAEPAPLPHDPWNAWVFTTGVGGMVSGEERQGNLSLSASLTANRTTEASKLVVDVRGSYRRDRFTFQLSDAAGVPYDTTIVSAKQDVEGSLLVAWSTGLHWSAGFKLSGGSNSFLNRAWALEGAPAIEYSLFPYDESTRRQLTVLYAAGGYSVEYEEETLFDRKRETLPLHRLEVALDFRQPWGSASVHVSGAQFLHDASKHNLSLGGNVSVRLVRGLSLNMSGSVARIKDQIYLPKGALTPEEVLLQRRQLGTDYRYHSTLGFGYTFGSPFSSAVNTRMRM